MSNEQKQIEEMAKVLKDYTKKNNIMASHVILESYAEELYKAGFKRQSENTIEVPCKIGDTIYLPWEWNGQKGIDCLTVTVLRCIVGLGWSFGTDFDTDDEDYYEAYNCGSFKLKDFGKTVFLSRDEAEAKMKGGAE